MQPQFEQNRPWISASTAEMTQRDNAFIRRVYGWMFLGLLITALATLSVAVVPAVQQFLLGNRGISLVLVIAELGLVFFLAARATRMSAGAAAASFIAFSLLTGLTTSWILFAYTAGTITLAFVSAAGMFGVMSIYGTVTKRDLTSMGSFMVMGLFGIVITSIANLFIHSTALSMTIAYIGVFVFLGLTAWDTQRIRAMAHQAPAHLQTNVAIIGALTLYLDFINLFLFMLRILGAGDRRR